MTFLLFPKRILKQRCLTFFDFFQNVDIFRRPVPFKAVSFIFSSPPCCACTTSCASPFTICYLACLTCITSSFAVTLGLIATSTSTAGFTKHSCTCQVCLETVLSEPIIRVSIIIVIVVSIITSFVFLCSKCCFCYYFYQDYYLSYFFVCIVTGCYYCFCFYYHCY